LHFTKEVKILIKNLFELKGYNAQLVREFLSKGWNVGVIYKSTNCCKSYRLLGWSTIVPVVADDAAPAQLIPLALLLN